jgi:hypothetical protein
MFLAAMRFYGPRCQVEMMPAVEYRHASESRQVLVNEGDQLVRSHLDPRKRVSSPSPAPGPPRRGSRRFGRGLAPARAAPFLRPSDHRAARCSARRPSRRPARPDRRPPPGEPGCRGESPTADFRPLSAFRRPPRRRCCPEMSRLKPSSMRPASVSSAVTRSGAGIRPREGCRCARRRLWGNRRAGMSDVRRPRSHGCAWRMRGRCRQAFAPAAFRPG